MQISLEQHRNYEELLESFSEKELAVLWIFVDAPKETGSHESFFKTYFKEQPEAALATLLAREVVKQITLGSGSTNYKLADDRFYEWVSLVVRGQAHQIKILS